jgi:hypothetical protein
MALNDWPQRSRAESSRQWPIFEEVADRAARAPAIDGLPVLGSFAGGDPDDLSDVDLVAVVSHGRFDQAWQERHLLETERRLVAWDSHPEPDCQGHKWITRDLVKVECCIVDPETGSMDLADPCAVLVGDQSLIDRFPRTPPIAPETLEAYAQGLRDELKIHEVELKYGEMKTAIRRVLCRRL